MSAPLFSSLLFLAAFAAGFAQDNGVNEADLFSDTATVTQAALTADSGKAALEQEKKHAGLSGEINVAGVSSFPRHNFGTPLLSSFAVGNVFADARLLDGIKGFVNAEARYMAQTDSAEFHLREIFMDVNIKNRVYFRAGKQILQWGRCYFWNPTDLISLDAKSQYFVQKVGYRDGAFGLKAHVPFGTAANIYGFLDTRNADTVGKAAGALKAEFLVGRTEMALAGWYKEGKPLVAGADFSTRIFGLDWSGEASLFREDLENRMMVADNTLYLVKGDETWTPRAAMNLSKSLTVNGVPDRLMLTVEGYYNGAGYDSRIFKDTLRYKNGATAPSNIPAMFLAFLPPDSGITKLEFFQRNGLYKPNQHAKYYAALFSSFSRFITSDMTLSFNAIGNIEEACAMISGGISYADLRDFSLGLTVIGAVGPDKTEYTYAGSALSVQLTAGLTF